ncbi:MAG: gliding motility lipoprotein GldH [Paludibacteraceae bacterium]|nr:gliding motility lipoprotein GldH [Paludibacteraceae bacterium]
MNKIIKYISLSVIAVAMLSCSQKIAYSQYQTIADSRWNDSDTLVYHVNIDDTTTAYDVIIDVRHTINYQYQNLWLFVNSDTIDFYLANSRGEWLGNGVGELREMPVLYKSNMRFDSCGVYDYKIVQAMRNKELKGIKEVGLIVEKSSGKE